MAFRSYLLLLVAGAFACSGSGAVVGPSPPSTSLTLTLSVSSGGTVDRTGSLLTVRTSFLRNELPADAQVWVCLANTSSTVIVSSCDRSGSVELSVAHPEIYVLDGWRVVARTDYVIGLIASGDIRDRWRYPPFEVSIGELGHVVARTVIEHTLYWR